MDLLPVRDVLLEAAAQVSWFDWFHLARDVLLEAAAQVSWFDWFHLARDVLLEAAARISRSSSFGDFKVAVAATVTAELICGIARYLASRIRRGGQSGDQTQFDFKLVKPDGTVLHVRGSDPDTVRKAWKDGLITVAAERRGQ